MLRLKEIYQYLDSISPFSLQESWDNSGLLIGNIESQIKDIYLSLEVTKELAQNAKEDSLIIAHHPLIFKPLNKIDFLDYPSNIIEILIKKNISLIAMHTNFDITHLNKYFVEKILGFSYFTKGIACIVEEEIEFDDLLKKFDYPIRYSKCKDKIHKIAIVCGSGMSEIESIYKENNIDCVITGDVKYHDVMKFKSLCISIIDANHYHSERFFGAILSPYLKDISYNAIIFDLENPFRIFKEQQ